MTAASLNREMFAALIEELGIVVGAMIDSPATVAPGAPAMGRQWVAQVEADGELTGTITVVLDHDGAIAITSLMTGIDGDMPDEALLDTLREVHGAGRERTGAEAGGARREAVGRRGRGERQPRCRRASGPPTRSPPTSSRPRSLSRRGAAWLSRRRPPRRRPGPKAVASPTPAPAKPEPAETASDDRIDVILDIDLPLVVRFGRTELPLKALTRLGPGSVIDLGRSPDDPVEVLVSNRVVARGEVVIVSGSYGIRILDVVSQRERVRSMEA